MKLEGHGKGTSGPETEVLNVSAHGLWLWVKGKEYFLSFTNFPWFKHASIQQVCKVRLLHQKHLYWPDLDVDLEVQSLERPSEYPRVAKATINAQFSRGLSKQTRRMEGRGRMAYKVAERTNIKKTRAPF